MRFDENFNVILEDFYNFLCFRKFKRRAKIEITNWQPFQFLRFAVNCYQCRSSCCKDNSNSLKNKHNLYFN